MVFHICLHLDVRWMRSTSVEYTEIVMATQLGAVQKKDPEFRGPDSLCRFRDLLYNEDFCRQVQTILYCAFTKTFVRFVAVIVVVVNEEFPLV